MPVSDLLDETFRVYRADFTLFLAVSLLIHLPSLVANLFTGSAQQLQNSFSVFGNMGSPARLQRISEQQSQLQAEHLPALLAYYAVVLVLIPFTTGALVLAARDVTLGQTTSWQHVLKETLKRYWGLAGLVMLIGLSVLINILIVTIPLWIWLLVRWSLAAPAMLVEGCGPVAGMRRSFELVKGHWWRVLGVLFLAEILAAVLGYGLGALLGGVAALIPGLGAEMRINVVLTGATLAAILTAPVQAIVTMLLYLDLRVRKEAFDLQFAAHRAAQAGTGQQVPGTA
jgi:hypothetical protein